MIAWLLVLDYVIRALMVISVGLVIANVIVAGVLCWEAMSE